MKNLILILMFFQISAIAQENLHIDSGLVGEYKKYAGAVETIRFFDDNSFYYSFYLDGECTPIWREYHGIYEVASNMIFLKYLNVINLYRDYCHESFSRDTTKLSDINSSFTDSLLYINHSNFTFLLGFENWKSHPRNHNDIKEFIRRTNGLLPNIEPNSLYFPLYFKRCNQCVDSDIELLIPNIYQKYILEQGIYSYILNHTFIEFPMMNQFFINFFELDSGEDDGAEVGMDFYTDSISQFSSPIRIFKVNQYNCYGFSITNRPYNDISDVPVSTINNNYE